MGSATQVCDISLPHETHWALRDYQLKLRFDPVATARGSDTRAPRGVLVGASIVIDRCFRS